MTEWIALARRPISATVPQTAEWPTRAEVEAALGPARAATHVVEINRMHLLDLALSNLEKQRTAAGLSAKHQAEFDQFLAEHRRLRHQLGVYPLGGAGVSE